jgi:molybdate transport system substrate-binding protein
MQLLSLNIRLKLEGSRQRHPGFKGRAGRRLLVVLCLLLLPALTNCSSGGPEPANRSDEVVVFAAASLTEAFGELASAFEMANPGAKIILNLAGSQQLAHQLSQGAPADVFASADEEQMAAAVEIGRVKSGKQRSFAGNELALVYPIDNPAGLRTLSDLARPGLQLILAAPEVPAGQYASLFLSAAAADPGYGPIFEERTLANVVSYEENVRAVLSKVRLGEADAGIVYGSDVTSGLAEEIGQIAIPEQINVRATYTIAPVADSENPELARAFIDFVLSPQGQALLSANGLLPNATE